MSEHSSSEATLIDDGGGYRVSWTAQALSQAHVHAQIPQPTMPVGRSTARMVVAPRFLPAPVPRSFWCTLDPRLALLAEPDSERAAGFRRLRDGVLARGMPRILAVTSPERGDGKTTCAANLAFAFAEQTREKLLLLDANLFAPALAGMFSIDEYAVPAPPHHAPWSAPYALTSLTPQLDLATVVLSRGEPLPRIDHDDLVRLLGSFFRAGYDRILLDAPALESSPVVSRLLDVAEGVLLAVRAGHTSERVLRRAADKIGPRKMIGAALMDSRLDSGG